MNGFLVTTSAHDVVDFVGCAAGLAVAAEQ
jgi:hypothetical protein